MEKEVVLEDCHGPESGYCPIQELLSRLGDKWSMLVLVALARAEHNRCRFSELMRIVTGISQRMLTTTLRHLERDGIVTRHVFAEVPPRVEYVLTERGQGLLVPVVALVTWIRSEWPEIEKSRQKYDARQPRSNPFPRGRTEATGSKVK
jgi:DNA-binding HxlR family transcriptional regulator